MHSSATIRAVGKARPRRLAASTIIASLVLWLWVVGADAQPHVESRDVATGLSVPIQMHWGPDSHLWVAERQGRISRINPETGEQFQILQIRDAFAPEARGIFGMILHPNFADSPQVFVYYSYQNVYPGGWDLWGKVVRYAYNEAQDSLIDPTIILDSLRTVQWNFGGGMVALPDHTLLVATGDGVEYYLESQSHASDRGKILRVGLDGSIPSDNPWKNYPRPLNALWATGFRNPIGLTRGPSGIVYGTDWGTSAMDEINIIEGGRNYGWPFILGLCDAHPSADEVKFCSDSNVVEPIHEWYKAESKTTGVAEIGFYDGEGIEHWTGSLLAATLLDGLHRLKLRDDGRRVEHMAAYWSPRLDSTSPGRLRALCISPDGRIFVGTSNLDGEGGPGGEEDRIIEILDADEVKDTVKRTPLEVRTVRTDLHVPWEVVWGYDNWLWITERNGRIGRVSPETGEYRNIATLQNVVERGATGLLGMALHPNFCDSPHVFLVYCYARKDNPELMWERLSRFTYDEGSETLIDEVVLVDSIDVSTSHSGSRVIATRDRKLFMTLSDGDQSHRTQDLTSKIGKILRLNIDGSIPDDNPWVDHPWPAGLIWSMGHRNPQGLTLSPDGKMYSSEHGPWSDDEINIIEKGANYGWPDVTGFCDTDAEQQYCDEFGITEPIIAWTPTIAPAGLAFYNHEAIPEWQGSLLLGLLKNNRIMQLKLSDDETTVTSTVDYLTHEYGRIRGLCVAPDGRVFFTVTNSDGVGTPREGDDRLMELSNALGHPALPAPGALCDSAIGVDTTKNGADDWPLLTGRTFVFPQPIRDAGTFELGVRFGKGVVRVYNVTGELMRSEQFNGGDKLRFMRGMLIPGVYLVEVADVNSVLHIRIVVQ